MRLGGLTALSDRAQVGQRRTACRAEKLVEKANRLLHSSIAVWYYKGSAMTNSRCGPLCATSALDTQLDAKLDTGCIRHLEPSNPRSPAYDLKVAKL